MNSPALQLLGGTKYSFIVGLLFLAMPKCLAQTPTPKSPPKQTQVQTEYLTKPLPLSVETVGPNFKGHDIAAILAEIRRSPMAALKTEFETTPAYQERVKSFLASKSRQYALVLPETADVELKYDADAGLMKVLVTASAPYVTNENFQTPENQGFDSAGFALRFLSRPTTYAKSNRGMIALNANVEEMGIITSAKDGMFAERLRDNGGIAHEATILLDMDAQTARAVKPFLRVALICTLIDSTIYLGHDSIPAAQSYPLRIDTEQFFVLVRSDELWVYDRRLGHVLGKFLP